MSPFPKSSSSSSSKETPLKIHLFILFYTSLLWLLLVVHDNTIVSKKTVTRSEIPSSIQSNTPTTANNSDQVVVSKKPCLGYQLGNISHVDSGLKAKLNLIGAPCHKFDQDIPDLTLEVTYETENRLHVHIYDTFRKQFQIPNQVFPLPNDIDEGAKEKSRLAFEYSTADKNSSAFEFWIRRTDGSNDIIFDTRQFPLIFEKQYLQISSHLPESANIFGLGEYIASSGFRRDPFNTTQAFWSRDQPNPVDENEYGVHPVYFEHRYTTTTTTTTAATSDAEKERNQDNNSTTPTQTTQSQHHAVFLKNSHGMDILLRKGKVEYRAIGGTLDFYFFAGPTPTASIEQYVQLVGLPQLQPYWSFGFHLLRWGYNTLEQTKETVEKMRQFNIPLEVQWNDIDYMLDYRNFELASFSSSDDNNNNIDKKKSDDVHKRFPIKEVKSFISKLHQNHQYYVPIIDAAIHKVDPNNSTDIYNVYNRGKDLDTFLKNPDGSEYIGKVWPGYTVFPDWFAKNTQNWWTEAFRNFSQTQVDFDGIWLDMNEPSSFCEGSCGSQIKNSSSFGSGMILPGEVGNLVTDYPEGYNSTLRGPSGNLKTSSLSTGHDELVNNQSLQKRDIKPSNFQFPVDSKNNDIPDKYLNTPGYSIHNGDGPLNVKTVSVNATHENGLKVYHTHNLWGHMEAIATHNALLEIHPTRRPFIVSRSTFAGGGRKTAHWLGDNYSTWKSMRYSIQGVLQFQAFGIPMIGPDTCGFNGNTSEELCNRWMMLSAFYPFYRNHNTKGSISQEPYVWESVAEASRRAIAIRYRLLPYFYSEMAKASIKGTPPIKALFWEFPNDVKLLGNDRQFMFGRSILVSPVLQPNVTTLDVTFPGNGDEIWRDWYTFKKVERKEKKEGSVIITLPAPISHINLHIRGGSILLLHLKPSYTTYETRQGPFELIVALDQKGYASTKVYMDDGLTFQPKESAWLEFKASLNGLKVKKYGNFKIHQKLEKVTMLGIMKNKMMNKKLSKLEVELKIDGKNESTSKKIMITNNPSSDDNDNDVDDIWVLEDDQFSSSASDFVFDLNESSWELIWS